MITKEELIQNGFEESSEKFTGIYYHLGPEDKVKLDGKGSLYFTHYDSLFGLWRKFDDPSLHISSVQDLKSIIYDYYDNRREYAEIQLQIWQEKYDEYSRLTL